MKVNILISLIFLSVVACQPTKQKEQTAESALVAVPQLTKIWETDTILST